MELRHLEYFVAVATDRNFTRAAQRLNLVQSALSAAVGKLEKDLGVSLFDRTRRPIELTAAGEVFLEHARDVLRTVHRAEHAVYDYRGELSGTVTLGSLMAWGTLDLPEALAQFRRRNPMVTVQLRHSEHGSAGHLTAIADGRLDLALVSAREPTPRAVALRELVSEPMVFVCDAAHRSAGRTSVPLTEVEGAEIVQFPPGWGIREQVDQACAAAGVRPVRAYEVADYAIAAELVRHRLAVMVIPRSAAARFPDLPTARTDPALTWSLYLASSAAVPATPPVVELGEVLARYARPRD